MHHSRYNPHVLMNCSAIANGNDLIILSELSDQERLSFLKAKGLTIPNIYTEEEQCIPFVRMVVNEVEANPNVNFTFNYHVLEDFANEIKSIVIDYYSSFSLPATYAWSYSNILQDNTVYGSWTSDYVNYRCYSYVMGYEDYMQPGQIKWTLLGNERTDYMYNYFSANLETIVDLVKDDLTELGYSYSEPTTTIPQTIVSQHIHLICMRKDYDTTGDYHFMKLGADGYWYHKPGETNPLRYNYTPTSDAPWVHEYYDGSTGRYYRYPNITYESEIYFIEYTTPHMWIYESLPLYQHSRTCNICGQIIEESCNLVYSHVGVNLHNAFCTGCSFSILNAPCTFTSTSNGDGTHTFSCTGCNSGYTENCELTYTSIGSVRHTATCSVCGNSNTEGCEWEYTTLSGGRHSYSCTKCDNSVSSEPCTYAYTANDDNTHTATCTLCSNSYDTDCGFTYEYSGDNSHHGVCGRCGNVKDEACAPESTYCGDGDQTHAHISICPKCDHVYGTGSTACTFAYKSNGDNTHVSACTQCRYIQSGPTACMFKSDNTCRFCGALKNSASFNSQEEDFSEN